MIEICITYFTGPERAWPSASSETVCVDAERSGRRLIENNCKQNGLRVERWRSIRSHCEHDS